MQSECTIVMYHYVRPLNGSSKNIKGLDLDQFIFQLKYLKEHFEIISMERLIESHRNKTALPANAMLLTFDDGYSDHYQNVLPILLENKVQGSFFPPVKAVKMNRVLDVNKIHHILAMVPNIDVLIDKIYIFLNNYKDAFNLLDKKEYFDKLAVPNRFDSKEVIFVKRLLQTELQEELRNLIVDTLFKEFVTEDEKSFAKDLYVSQSQLVEMSNEGMHIGGHGYSHSWLGNMTKQSQIFEIQESRKFVNEITRNSEWTMCFPYGSYNNQTLEILKNEDCSLSLTTQVGVANLQEHNILSLPRLDTNDFPR